MLGDCSFKWVKCILKRYRSYNHKASSSQDEEIFPLKLCEQRQKAKLSADWLEAAGSFPLKFSSDYPTEGWRDESCHKQTYSTDRLGGNLNTGFVWRVEEKKGWDCCCGITVNVLQTCKDPSKDQGRVFTCFTPFTRNHTLNSHCSTFCRVVMRLIVFFPPLMQPWCLWRCCLTTSRSLKPAFEASFMMEALWAVFDVCSPVAWCYNLHHYTQNYFLIHFYSICLFLI